MSDQQLTMRELIDQSIQQQHISYDQLRWRLQVSPEDFELILQGRVWIGKVCTARFTTALGVTLQDLLKAVVESMQRETNDAPKNELPYFFYDEDFRVIQRDMRGQGFQNLNDALNFVGQQVRERKQAMGLGDDDPLPEEFFKRP